MIEVVFWEIELKGRRKFILSDEIGELTELIKGRAGRYVSRIISETERNELEELKVEERNEVIKRILDNKPVFQWKLSLGKEKKISPIPF